MLKSLLRLPNGRMGSRDGSCAPKMFGHDRIVFVVRVVVVVVVMFGAFEKGVRDCVYVKRARALCVFTHANARAQFCIFIKYVPPASACVLVAR